MILTVLLVIATSTGQKLVETPVLPERISDEKARPSASSVEITSLGV